MLKLKTKFYEQMTEHQHEMLIDATGNEYSRRYSTSLIYNIFSMIFCVIMAVINIVQGYNTISMMLLACAFVCLNSAALQLYTRSHRLPALLLCSAHIMLTWLMFTIGSTQLWSLMWTLAYPHAFMLCLGLTEGVAMSLCFIASMILLGSPPMQQLLPHKYESAALARYIVVLLGSFAIAFIAEFLRDHAQKKLTLLTQHETKMAFTDPLTRLGNRMAFEQHLQREYARFTRINSGGLCLIMCDIDHFKLINDSHGHAVGDAVLQHTADLMLGRLRRQDGIFRWGGEEFILTLTGLSAEDAGHVAEELRFAVAASPCPYQNEHIYFTMSFGVYYCNKNESAKQAMERVDALLYAAKRSGRNRIMIDGL